MLVEEGPQPAAGGELAVLGEEFLHKGDTLSGFESNDGENEWQAVSGGEVGRGNSWR